MKLFFSTDWTLNDSLLTEVDNIITLHPQEVVFTPTSNNVCLMAHNELGEVIATSGCGEEEPLITEGFIRFWVSEGFPAEMDIDISLLYLEDYFEKLNSGEFDNEMEETFEEFLLDNGLSLQFPHQDLQEIEETWHSTNHLYELVCEDSDSEEDECNSSYFNDWQNCESKLMRLVDKLKSKYNQLPEIPSEITTFTDMYGNVYDSLEACEEGELRHKHTLDCEEFYRKNPTGGEHSFQQMLAEEGLQRKDKEQYLDFINNPVNEISLGEPEELVLFSENLDKLMDAQVSDWQETEDLSNESEFTQNLLIAQREKTAKRIELEKYYDLVQLEKEGRQNLRKHVLVKKANLQPRVDFSLLPNASGIIWTALTLLKDGAIDINHEIYQNAVKTANNLDLFMRCMKNPKFATKASSEIEKILNK